MPPPRSASLFTNVQLVMGVCPSPALRRPPPKAPPLFWMKELSVSVMSCPRLQIPPPPSALRGSPPATLLLKVQPATERRPSLRTPPPLTLALHWSTVQSERSRLP